MLIDHFKVLVQLRFSFCLPARDGYRTGAATGWRTRTWSLTQTRRSLRRFLRGRQATERSTNCGKAQILFVPQWYFQECRCWLAPCISCSCWCFNHVRKLTIKNGNVTLSADSVQYFFFFLQGCLFCCVLSIYSQKCVLKSETQQEVTRV